VSTNEIHKYPQKARSVHPGCQTSNWTERGLMWSKRFLTKK